MTEESRSRLMDCWESLREIKNLMGRMTAAYTTRDEAEIFSRYWCDLPDCSLGVNEGYFVGPEEVARYYRELGDRIREESRIIRDAFPHALGGRTDEEIYGVGLMTYRPVDTGVVEIAEDGKTAKGIWCIRGSYSELTEAGPIAKWEWGWFACDFVEVGGTWKIWHMLYLQEIDRRCGEPWVGENTPLPAEPRFSAVSGLSRPVPTVRRTLRERYDLTRRFTMPPRLPEAYRTFAETFSYGYEEA